MGSTRETQLLFRTFYSQRDGDLLREFRVLIALHGEAVAREFIKIVHIRVDVKYRGALRLVCDDLLYRGHVPVVYVRIRDNVHEFARLKPGHLRQHHRQHCILHDVPVVRRQHVL